MMRNIVVCAVILTAALRAAVPDVAGQWLVVATFDRPADGKSTPQPVKLLCTFEQHDTALAGSCRPADAPEGLPLTGTAGATTIEWSFQIAPNATAARQSAIFRGTSGSGASAMSGRFEFGESRGRFRATKQ